MKIFRYLRIEYENLPNEILFKTFFEDTLKIYLVGVLSAENIIWKWIRLFVDISCFKCNFLYVLIGLHIIHYSLCLEQRDNKQLEMMRMDK